MANKQVTKAPEKKTQISQPARSLSLFEEMDRWFDEAFPNHWMQRFNTSWPFPEEIDMKLQRRVPKVDVIDKKKKIVVRAELPGIEKDDLEITVSDNAVTLKGETKHEKTEGEKGDYYRSEISQSSFMRRVSLPYEVESGGAKAKFKNGVLELSLPKAKKRKRKTIKVE
ncbi:Hsp20/alpha crystallin family protein [Solemya velum gill symbiont]|uniref:Hsp20/alpha crystallin family protein n=1 Tax=Solemya velum gill symbiont TaxID=2340 RepID=UPI000996E6CA|nr:Hsp20/alpha crystallin family protein [Solemya velum gill symbiont]OOY53743.1 heat-shock protein Hsp20 [Solemya velum gill symbiont]OOY57542.1 heat-shock protein Hsp20 [Solemya velum gill symbiont]OOY58566.1 heat-shock protein Hsp20 [Solemya velum gill symbiont]OOY61202.1 heat-shock protein Hsp20 [Solemya velum gill symbiont]OOY62730.1 heat-shock protein Hsp20 [Solemya velum gill symbiont]